MAVENATKYSFIKDWKKLQLNVLERVYPEIPRPQLVKELDGLIQKHLVNPKGLLINNYKNYELNVDLLSLIDWMKENKPIIGGYGVLYHNQHEVLNPVAIMLENFLTKRKEYKGQLRHLKKGSYDYMKYDRLQLSEKINANSYYGASGAPSSNYYNVFTATSVTATGQSLISTTEQAFEMFMTNSVKFINFDECIQYVENIRSEKSKMADGRIPNVPIHMVQDHLIRMFHHFDANDEETLFGYLMGISQTQLNRIYFKNNLYAFTELPEVKALLVDTMSQIESFTDPNEIPHNVEKDFEKIWDLYEDFVCYNHFTFERINRLKYDKRDTVVVVDTDSNMLNLDPWVTYVNENLVPQSSELMQKDYDTMRFISINTMCFLLTRVTTKILNKYGKMSNIPKDYRHLINMKNEYLFTRMVTADSKKRYVTSVRLREGSEIFPEEVDIKGFDFTKSNTREETKQYLIGILENRILFSDEINVADVLRDIKQFEDLIQTSLRSGERSFLIPISPKELDAYDNPYSQQGPRAVICWNLLFPDQEIQLPAKVDMVKVKIPSLETVAHLEATHPEIYARFRDKIFNHKHPKISGGMTVLAIPRNIQDIPKWIFDFVDFDTICMDNLSKFYPILESLGFNILGSTGQKRHFSNVLAI